jgi:dihydrofolate reductase
MEAIYAVDINFGLAKNETIPWYCKRDLAFFKCKTIHNIVVMGRKTFFSLKQQLSNRINIVLTKTPEIYKHLENDELFFVTDNELFDVTNKYPNKNIFIIGGKEIYEKYIPLCSKVWITQLKKNYDCDIIFDYCYPNRLTNFEDNDEFTIYVYNNI